VFMMCCFVGLLHWCISYIQYQVNRNPLNPDLAMPCRLSYVKYRRGCCPFPFPFSLFSEYKVPCRRPLQCSGYHEYQDIITPTSPFSLVPFSNLNAQYPPCNGGSIVFALKQAITNPLHPALSFGIAPFLIRPMQTCTFRSR
jgi:hypothetical protein